MAFPRKSFFLVPNVRLSAKAKEVEDSMVILGIDPGSRKMGYGVVKMEGNNLQYLGSGCIVTGTEALHLRLLVIFDAVTAIIEQFKPEHMAIEETFVAKNVQSTIKLSESRAVAMVVGARAGLDVFEYTPMQIKQAVVGYGAAQKNQVQYMVKNILHLNGLPQSDAADALACAICHGYTNKVSAVLGRTTGAISSVNGRWRSPTKW